MRFEVETTHPRIKILGLGEGGINLLKTFSRTPFSHLETIALDNHPLTLSELSTPLKILLPSHLEERRELFPKRDLEPLLEDTEIGIIIAGLGGEVTGRFLLPLVREIKEREGLVIVVGIFPFYFEGKKKRLRAEELRRELSLQSDALLIFSNETFHRSYSHLPLNLFFEEVNARILDILLGIIEPLLTPSFLPLDLPTFRRIIEDGGEIVLGWGEERGENRSFKVIDAIIHESPWRKEKLRTIRRVLINVRGGEDLTMQELSRISEAVTSRVSPEADIAVSAVIKESYHGEIRVTLMGIKSAKRARGISFLEERSSLC